MAKSSVNELEEDKIIIWDNKSQKYHLQGY